MEHQSDTLWSGGGWEQRVRVYPTPPAVNIPPRPAQPPRPRLQARKKRARSQSYGLLALIITLCVLTFSLGRLSDSFAKIGSKYLDPDDAQSEYSTDPPSIDRAAVGTGVTVTLLAPTQQTLSYREIYEKNLPSLVSIEGESDKGFNSGTGVILTQDGYIITNAHVVAGTHRVQVMCADNAVYEAALVGFDADEDLAVLKVDADNLQAADFGDSSMLHCGESVAAMGDPLGYRSSITDGIVSALDRQLDMDGVTMTLIQTSAAINFGNSGGALLNEYGQVVGITTIKIVTEDGSAEALGFAIPSQRVKYVVDTLISGQRVRAGVFGFTVLTHPAQQGGLILESVHPKSDAAKKGLQEGDIILTANGMLIASAQDLMRVKLSCGAGDAVTVTYLREGIVYTVDVALVAPEIVSAN